MSITRPACSRCSVPVPESLLQTSESLRCPTCQAELRLQVFPALHRPPVRGAAPERIIMEGEASCFYHPEKRAVVPCDACGRFLCALCDLDLKDQHICPACLQARQDKNQMPELVTRRTLYDSAALLLTLVTTMLFCLWFAWIVTAPVAIFLAVLSWRKPGSILRASHWRAVLAIILAVLQLLAFAGMIQGFSRHLLDPWAR